MITKGSVRSLQESTMRHSVSKIAVIRQSHYLELALHVLCALCSAGIILICNPKIEAEERFKLLGRESAIVDSDSIRVRDLVEAPSSTASQHDSDHLNEILSVTVEQSPALGQDKIITGEQVIAAIRRAGIDTQSFWYSFPRNLVIHRQGRELSEVEAKAFLEQQRELLRDGSEIKNLFFEGARFVPSGEISLSLGKTERAADGAHSAELLATSQTGSASTVKVKLYVDSFNEVLIASRAVARGEILREGDFERARLNIRSVPARAAVDEADVLGLEAKRAISAGRIIQSEDLKLPNLIQAGKQITLKYEKGRLVATVLVIALESGAAGDYIRVRNEDSKKVLTAKVVSEGLVEVKAQ